jgi:hypothetical protein
MKITLRWMTLILFLAVFLSYSCKKSDSLQTSNNVLDSLKETPIGGTGFYISLPAHYSLKENEGPDFSVFYFASTDTTQRSNFSGGMYFGNFPNEFEVPSDSCKTEKITGAILGSNAKWTTYDCNGRYSIQTIADSKSNEGWNSKIHAFGHASTKDDLHKVLQLYSTLKKK